MGVLRDIYLYTHEFLEGCVGYILGKEKVHISWGRVSLPGSGHLQV